MEEDSAPLTLLLALTLLLETARSLPEGGGISISAVGGPDQFDFRISGASGIEAVRIRATRSMFLFSKVEALAGELDQDPGITSGQLWLIGMAHPRLEKVKAIGKVTLTKRSYDPEILLQEAAAAVAAFRQTAGLPAGAAALDERMANQLAGHLQSWCNEPRELGLGVLREILRDGINKASAAG